MAGRCATPPRQGARPTTSAGFNTSLGATSPLTGLLLFKLGAGADVVEMVGERELVISRFWHFAFERAMAARIAINKRRKAARASEDARRHLNRQPLVTA